MSKLRSKYLYARNTINYLNRRELLKGVAVMGGGGIISDALAQTSVSHQDQDSAVIKQLTYEDVLRNARARLYPTCRVCLVCDGIACSGDSSLDLTFTDKLFLTTFVQYNNQIDNNLNYKSQIWRIKNE